MWYSKSDDDKPPPIKAHKVRAYLLPGHSLIRLCSIDIHKAAVWNQSSTFAKSYLRDMSQQVADLHSLGPIVVAQENQAVQSHLYICDPSR